MSKVIYINKEAALLVKEQLVTERNNYLLAKNYTEADKVLNVIQDLNDVILNML